MPRSLPSDFMTQCQADYSRPYFILAINWGTSVSPIWRYYMDRDSNSFVATGTRKPSSGLVTNAFVIDWGENTMRLREQQVNSVEGRTVKIEDTEGHIRAMFASTVRQQKGVIIYRMFDADAVTWDVDAVPVFAGSILPMQWSENDCIVTLQFEDAARRFFPDIGIYATQSVFGAGVPPDSRDKMLPIAWGKVHRVKAVRVAGPWETKTRTSFVGTTGSVVVDIDDHPSELGIGVLGSSGSPIPVFIGPDLVNGYFTESGSPDDTPSTFTIVSGAGITMASAVIEMVVGSPTRDAYVRATSVRPDNQQTALTDIVTAGNMVRVFIFDPTNNWVDTTVSVISPDTPWPGWYRIRFTSSSVQTNMTPGSMIHFLSTSVNRRGWQSGVTMSPKLGNSIYIANAFTSHGVIQVEGYGNVWDMNGESRKDFVKLGRSFYEGLVGTVPFAETDYENYTVDLDDPSWSMTLGHNCTTITMAALPRSMNPDLETNDVWVTLLGIPEDLVVLNDEVRNPALVILQYLESPYLLNLAASNIDYASFTTATTALAGYFVGWAQTKPMKGIELLQEIARQCHSIILLDGDKVQLIVLQNDSITAALTFDTGTNQSPAGTNDNIKAGSLELGESSIVDIVTNMVGKWIKYRDEITGKNGYNVQVINTGALAIFERKEREMPIDLFWRRDDVANEIGFWVTRESRIYGTVKFIGYHDALKLLPGDWINITYWAGHGAAIDSGTDLKTESTVNVSAVSHVFTGDDVGRKLIINSGGGWISGDYTILSISGSEAVLDRPPGTHPLTLGVFSIRASTDVVLQNKYCELVAVTDKGPDGEVAIECRYPKFSF